MLAFSPILQRVEGFFRVCASRAGSLKSSPARWRDVRSEGCLQRKPSPFVDTTAFQGGLRRQLVSRLRVPEQGQIIDKEDQGAVRVVVLATRFCGSSKPEIA